MEQQDPNKLFRYRLGHGDAALRILLSKNESVSVTAQSSTTEATQSKGIVRVDRPSDDILRKKKKVTGTINFWDLGQILDDTDYIDIPWQIVPTPDGAGHYFEFGPSDWDDFWAYIFTIDIADWEDNYKKLSYEEAERYGLDVYDNINGIPYEVSRNGPNLGNDPPNPVTDTKWTEQGLKIPNTFPTNISIECGALGAFFLWALDPDFTKITNTYDYSASAVPFSFVGKNTKMFLVPRITTTYLFSDSGTGDSDSVTYPFKVLPRSFFLNKDYDVDPYPLYSAGGGLDLSAADKIDFQALIETDPDSQYWDSTAGYGGSPSTYPAYALNRAIEVNQIGGLSFAPVSLYPGTLMAVFKQGTSVYYLWSTATGASINSREILL